MATPKPGTDQEQDSLLESSSRSPKIKAVKRLVQWCHDFAAGVAGVEVPMALPAEALQAAPAEAPQAGPHAGAALVPQPGVGGHGKKRPADEAWVVQTHGEFFY